MKTCLDAERSRNTTWCFSPAAACRGNGWAADRPGERDSAGVFRAAAGNPDQLRTALRRFVDVGGTLYASDWQYGLVAIAFPNSSTLQNRPRAPSRPYMPRWSTRGCKSCWARPST